jgi:hypothetical protein
MYKLMKSINTFINRYKNKLMYFVLLFSIDVISI